MMTAARVWSMEGRVTLKAAAETLGISYWAARRLAQRYNVPAVRVGNVVMVDWKQFLAARRTSQDRAWANGMARAS